MSVLFLNMKILNLKISTLIKLALYCIFCAFVIHYLSNRKETIVYDMSTFISIGVLALLMYIVLVIDRVYQNKKQG